MLGDVCVCLWCNDARCVCVKLPLLACRDTDSPSDKPHLHLQSQLLRLTLFSLISKLPLIPSVLYLAALGLLRPHGNQMLGQFNVCCGHNTQHTLTCMHMCSADVMGRHSTSLSNISNFIHLLPLTDTFSLFSPLSPSLPSFYQWFSHRTHFSHTITNTDFLLRLWPNPIG